MQCGGAADRDCGVVTNSNSRKAPSLQKGFRPINLRVAVTSVRSNSRSRHTKVINQLQCVVNCCLQQVSN